MEGNAGIEKDRLLRQKIVALRSWGKLRVHFLPFGSYRINGAKDAPVRLGLAFADGELNFYSCSVKFIEEPLDAVYDWRVDVMSDRWDAALARAKLRAALRMLACDALLDQDIFAGVGNIIKNEVLFRIQAHSLSTVGALPPAKLRTLVERARAYSFDFYKWKKAFALKKHWLAHTKTICPRCAIPFSRGHLGKSKRRSFFCENCQVRYG